METLEYVAVLGSLELRQVGGARQIVGRFPYGRTATISDRGSVRKERINSRAFGFTIDDQPTAKIDLLVGHDFGKPIASRQSGTLRLAHDDDAVTFEADLPLDPPTWVIDAEKAVSSGVMTGLSPGFRVPPRATVPGAETLIPEAGNPGVQIRQINQAVLREFSVVTNAVYEEAAVMLRSEDGAEGNAILLLPSRRTLWL